MADKTCAALSVMQVRSARSLGPERDLCGVVLEDCDRIS